MSPILEVRGLARRYGGVAALDGLDLAVQEGETRCVIGPNGAGKTTFLNVVCGLVRPSAGTVIFDGRDTTRMSPARIARRGLMRSFQTPSVFPRLTIEGNLELGARRPSAPEEGRTERIAEIMDELDFSARADVLARELSHGETKRLELGMMLVGLPRVLMLDEPTAGMGIRETSEIVALLRRLCAGITVVVIEHDMSFVRQIADSVSVLHRGALLVEGGLDEIRADERVQRVYLGAAVA